MRKWIAVAAVIVAAVALALLAFALARGLAGVVGAVTSGSDAPDPMFSEPPVVVTRPPEPEPEPTADAPFEDRSGSWTYRTLTPIEP